MMWLSRLRVCAWASPGGIGCPTGRRCRSSQQRGRARTRQPTGKLPGKPRRPRPGTGTAGLAGWAALGSGDRPAPVPSHRTWPGSTSVTCGGPGRVRRRSAARKAKPSVCESRTTMWWRGSGGGLTLEPATTEVTVHRLLVRGQERTSAAIPANENGQGGPTSGRQTHVADQLQ